MVWHRASASVADQCTRGKQVGSGARGLRRPRGAYSRANSRVAHFRSACPASCRSSSLSCSAAALPCAALPQLLCCSALPSAEGRGKLYARLLARSCTRYFSCPYALTPRARAQCSAGAHPCGLAQRPCLCQASVACGTSHASATPTSLLAQFVMAVPRTVWLASFVGWPSDA